MASSSITSHRHTAAASTPAIPTVAEARRVLRRLEFHYTPKRRQLAQRCQLEIEIRRPQRPMSRSPHRKLRPARCRDRRLAVSARATKAALESTGCSPPTRPEPKWRVPIPIPRSKSHNLCAEELDDNWDAISNMPLASGRHGFLPFRVTSTCSRDGNRRIRPEPQRPLRAGEADEHHRPGRRYRRRTGQRHFVEQREWRSAAGGWIHRGTVLEVGVATSHPEVDEGQEAGFCPPPS